MAVPNGDNSAMSQARRLSDAEYRRSYERERARAVAAHARGMRGWARSSWTIHGSGRSSSRTPASGLFWITPLPATAVRADVARGTAMMRVTNAARPDFHDVEASIRNGLSVPATVSYEAEWSSPLARATLRNDAQGWGGQFVETQSRVAWSARQDGFSYQSDPAASSVTVWGVVGRERNGVFLQQLGLPLGLPATGARPGIPRAGPALGAAGTAGAALGAAGTAGAALAVASLVLRHRRPRRA